MKYFIVIAVLLGFVGNAYANESQPSFGIVPVNLNYDGAEIRNVFDWTSNDALVLFSADLEDGSETLLVASKDGNIVKQPNIASVDNSSPIIHAQFDPSDDNVIHFLKNGILYSYDLNDDNITQLTNDEHVVSFFDYLHESNSTGYAIVYSATNTLNPKQIQLLKLEEYTNKTQENTPEILGNIDHIPFQISHDGKKILFLQTLSASYGQAERRLAYYDMKDFRLHVLSDLNIRCGNYPKWLPNDELIVYHISYCGRSAPGGILGMISLDGVSNQILLPDNNDNPRKFAISNDGSVIAIVPSTNGKSYGMIADFYLLSLNTLTSDEHISKLVRNADCIEITEEQPDGNFVFFDCKWVEVPYGWIFDNGIWQEDPSVQRLGPAPLPTCPRIDVCTCSGEYNYYNSTDQQCHSSPYIPDANKELCKKYEQMKFDGWQFNAKYCDWNALSDPYTNDESMRLASEKVGVGGLGIDPKFDVISIVAGIAIGIGSALGLLYYWRKQK